GKLLWGMAAVAGVALLLSAAAFWLALGSGEGNGGTAKSERNGGASEAALHAVRTELRTLAARVNELAVIIEGPMSHLRESNEGTLVEIEQRLAQLEQQLSQNPQSEPQGQAAQAEPSQEKGEQQPVASKEEAPAKAQETVDTAAASDGWAINLVSLSSESDANAELKRLRQLGVEAQMRRAQRNGQTWYRLRVAGFDNYEQAKAYIDTVEKRAGVKGAWVAEE
ncbi:MAG: SPOR domain-containing protein, partial [Pseudomonadota bacterium]